MQVRRAICQVLAGAESGGLERHFIELCNALAERHQVTAIAHPLHAHALDGRVHFVPLDLSGGRFNPRLLLMLYRALRRAAPEFGWVGVRPTEAGTSDHLMSHFSASEQVYQWHSDTFTLPSAAVHLAESDGCRNQAFRLYDHVYGFQFHLEADAGLIGRWIDAPQSAELLASHGIDLDRNRTMEACGRLLPRAAELGRAVFGEFINRFYRFRRRHAHASR